MSRLSAILFILISFTSILFVSACSKDVKPSPTNINVEIKAAPTANPDGSGRASPIVVRIYALKSLGKFNTSDYYSLYSDEQAQLGGDMVSREEFHLMPGGQKIYTREVPASTLYLGVIAAFRDLDNAVWRSSIPLPGGRTTNFSVTLDNNTVSIRAE